MEPYIAEFINDHDKPKWIRILILVLNMALLDFAFIMLFFTKQRLPMIFGGVMATIISIISISKIIEVSVGGKK